MKIILIWCVSALEIDLKLPMDRKKQYSKRNNLRSLELKIIQNLKLTFCYYY